MSNPFEQFMQQAKNIQETFKKVEEDLKSLRIVGEAGAGMVKVTVDGRRRVHKIEVDNEIYKEERSIVLDLIMAGFNDALNKVDETTKTKMVQFAARFGLPANFSLPFNF